LDWLQIASSLGLGGAVGAVLGVISAAKQAQARFDGLSKAVTDSIPEHSGLIREQFEAFRLSFVSLRGALEQLRRAFRT
jgi:hypothetical protein